jgi:nucleoside-diphosphate-sugar epimerase
VGDLARAVEIVLALDQATGVYNVVGGSIRVSDLVEAVAERLQVKVARVGVPHWLAEFGLFASTPSRVLPVVRDVHRTLRSWMANAKYSEKSLRGLGFRPQTTLHDAIVKEVDAYRR